MNKEFSSTPINGENIEGKHHGRYSRQELFTPFGAEGQTKLRNSHVLIIGAGALGTGIAETLARGGVGHLTIVDRDYVEWSNLQRQQLYNEDDVKQRLPKAVAAKKRLQAINSEITIDIHVMDAGIDELNEWIEAADLVMDATDNFDTRLIINDLAVKYGTPWIYGGCVGSYGITYTFIPGKTPCLNCLLGEVPLGGDTCDTAGILPQTVQMVTANQTMEAFKWLSGNLEAMRKKLLSFDMWRNEYTLIGVDRAKNPSCLSCGTQRTYPYLNAANNDRSEVLCGRDTVQIRPARKKEWDLEQLAERLRRLNQGKVETNPFLISFQLDTQRMVIFKDGRALVHGTKDKAAAKSLYHRYFG